MHRTTLLASSLAILLGGATSLAFAQNSPVPRAPATTSTVATPGMTPMHGMMPMHNQANSHHDRKGWSHGSQHERGGVIGDLHGLERLYMESGRSKEMIAVYNDVLTRSQNPRVRDYVYKRLARLQAQPANVDQAIATLRKGLDENLANDAKIRAERETMRSKWQQRSGKTPAAATSSD
ncbi:MAG: hypothetical protein ABIU96_02705 [Rhodanobacter sp.]